MFHAAGTEKTLKKRMKAIRNSNLQANFFPLWISLAFPFLPLSCFPDHSLHVLVAVDRGPLRVPLPRAIPVVF